MAMPKLISGELYSVRTVDGGPGVLLVYTRTVHGYLEGRVIARAKKSISLPPRYHDGSAYTVHYALGSFVDVSGHGLTFSSPRIRKRIQHIPREDLPLYAGFGYLTKEYTKLLSELDVDDKKDETP
ncbi:MAG: hypothetical protein GF334_05465 [Candidatus Altiarchaeales archaeon]|nr:hypothetical protein [Candidatus Altiarchaeales archaeon]